jgi:hypothetical protein
VTRRLPRSPADSSRARAAMIERSAQCLKWQGSSQAVTQNGQRQAQSRAGGRRNRSHHPRPWVFPPRPWTKPDVHGRIADGGGPQTRLERRMCWCASRTLKGA